MSTPSRAGEVTPAAAPARGVFRSLAGTTELLRVIARRDRIRLALWVSGITGVTAASAAAVKGLYATPDQVAGYARLVRSSATSELMNGAPRAVDSVGGIVAYEATLTAVVAVSLMSLFTVVRHTRAEEETGRAEIWRATPVGRHAAPLAAVVVAGTVSLLIGLLDALVLVWFGLPASGSCLHGAGLAGIGLVFTGIAASAAQVTASARSALGIGGAVLAALVVVRGVGDVTDTWVSWLSPLAWMDQAQAFGRERAWPLVLLPLAAAGGFTLTVYLLGRRDAGAGLRQPRSRPARATRFLGTPVGLAWRLQRGLWIGWGLGLGLMAVLFGSLGDEVVEMVESNPELAEMMLVMGGDVAVRDSFFAYGVGLLAVLASAPGVASVLRLRGEELAGHAEPLLSTGLTRAQWAGGHLVVTVLASAVVFVLVGVAVGGAEGLVAGRWESLPTVLRATLALLPAALVIAAVAVLLVGWVPRYAPAAWVVVGFAILQNYLGGLLDLPDVVADLSPYTHLPLMPVQPWEAGPVLVLLALAAALVGLALLGLRRRDVS